MKLTEQERTELNAMRESLRQELGVTKERQEQEERVAEAELRAVPRENLILAFDFLNQAARQFCEDYELLSPEDRVTIGMRLIHSLACITEDAPTGDSEDKAFYIVAAIEKARLARQGGGKTFSCIRLYEDVFDLYEEEEK
jgi:hypothetical protein